MTERQANATLQVAKRLINHLPETLNKDLKELLARADEGQDTTFEVIDLLSKNENLRLWMREETAMLSGSKGAETRGYSSPAGSVGPIPASLKWVCPERGCHYLLPIIQEGEPAPTCNVHGVKMVRSRKKKGQATMLNKFWESIGTKVADRWLEYLFGPAFLFWAGGLGYRRY